MMSTQRQMPSLGQPIKAESTLRREPRLPTGIDPVPARGPYVLKPAAPPPGR